jgi:hypothetical protein
LAHRPWLITKHHIEVCSSRWWFFSLWYVGTRVAAPPGKNSFKLYPINQFFLEPRENAAVCTWDKFENIFSSSIETTGSSSLGFLFIGTVDR